MRHLVVGAGPAGVIAAETLRRFDASASVVIAGDESEAPYSRMALPYLLADQIAESGTHLRHAPAHYDDLGIEVRRERVARLDPGAGKAVLSSGEELSWDKALLACGSRPTRPPLPGATQAGVHTCWTLADARLIAAQTQPGSKVVLMGAGFIGCIVLEALAARGVDLTVVEMANRMLPRMMDGPGGSIIKSWCERKGVKVLTATRVDAIERQGLGLQLTFGDGERLTVDLVVCATGVQPNADWLEGTGIEVDDGIVVDRQLRTSIANVYAAGDVAQGPDFSTGGRAVHAIQPTASEHGRIAALNMLGRETPYAGSLSMNVLNTLGLVSSSFGLWDGAEDGTQAVASDPDNFRYLRLEFDQDRLVGALALGLTQHVGVIRGLIQSRLSLGPWHERLLRDPTRVPEAYLSVSQAQGRDRGFLKARRSDTSL